MWGGRMRYKTKRKIFRLFLDAYSRGHMHIAWLLNEELERS